MFTFLRRKKPEVTINSISIPTFGWEIVEQNDAQIVWVNPEQSALISLYFFNIPPDLPTVKNIDELRNFHRHSVSASGGGIVEVSIFNLHNIPSVKTIFKIPQPEQGMSYLASVTIPFENCSFVIKTQAVEVGTTGMRDNLVLNRFLQNGEVTFDDNGLKNWFEDPYDPSFKEGALMNKSETEEYDNDFPHHPLSIVRSMIKKAIEEVILKDELKRLTAFSK
ncbi:MULTISPECIES: hypothetical protein [Chryseobacterium]|jgi:hypothetical protein|uniref:hypothetical protein n=1 Tax=Chryseobacterium TaxID=59732 RepID=UPI00210C6803|nr:MULTISPECIES: hypothetical protein [Chryseobacterium]MCQ4138523.1 hypothetical protein [Chryseobacterium sp. EO14]WBV54282.1 hypothetical protein PFY09_08150 [Chryseobacterium gambrini]WBX98675.1 hypothetical protein PE065_05315 [Chryseobacterium gambrini]